jgi:hypothetical protein
MGHIQMANLNESFDIESQAGAIRTFQSYYLTANQ